MDKDAEEFWKEWVTDLKDELDTYKKLAKERGELNVKLAQELERAIVNQVDVHNSSYVSRDWMFKCEDKSKWICTACGKSTYETEYDYLAAKDLHLECALKEEMKNEV